MYCDAVNVQPRFNFSNEIIILNPLPPTANWDGIHDYESGILGFSLTVGIEVCEERLHPYHDPHKHIVPLDDDSQWTHVGVVNTKDDVSLPGGYAEDLKREIPGEREGERERGRERERE